MLISSTVSSNGKKNYKYLIYYKYDDTKIKSLCMMFPKTKAHVKHYDSETKWMSFLIKNDELLKNNYISNKFSDSIKTELDSKPIYQKLLKTKMNSCGNEITDFHNREIPEVCPNYMC